MKMSILLYWLLFPILVLLGSKILVSLFSLTRRFNIKTPDIAVVFLFVGIHFLSMAIFKESILPYFTLTIVILGMALAGFQAYFYDEIDYRRYLKLYWRSTFLFSMGIELVLVIFGMLLL